MNQAGRPRLAVVCDYLEENWPSMDLVADRLISSLQDGHAGAIDVTRIQPPMKRRWRRSEAARGPGGRAAFSNIDRGINRFLDYPRQLKRAKDDFDVFHIVDHCYAHLVHATPSDRTVVTCHDLETFKSLLEPERFPRSRAYRAMVGRILQGLGKAERVVCDTEAVAKELISSELVDGDRIRVVPLGVDEIFASAPDPLADAEVTAILGPPDPTTFEILHVGGTFYRKRIDRLLSIFAAIRKEAGKVRLIRVGGDLTEEQRRIAEDLGIAADIVELPFISQSVLAGVYRRADAVLLPSEMEGFGFPALEALASGTPFVASDLPVLREVAGDAAVFCDGDDIGRWRDEVVKILRLPGDGPFAKERRARGIEQAARFGWANYAEKMLTVYEEIVAA